jgi:4-amino-4-deoxy-L-arabinose transferase-like glycosyltransferase
VVAKQTTNVTSAAPTEAPPAPGWFQRLSERQLALAVLLFGVLLYVPFAGSYGLFDPWETHYGEVARQMTERHDYVRLFWPGSPTDSAYFWSKPVLTFWLMSLSLHLFGLGQAGGPPDELAVGTAAEWALRLPFCLMALLALYGVYLVAARFVSRRAGVLAAVVLGTSPLFALVARQAMTDMAFLGPMTLALALGTLALFDDDDRDLARRSWRGLSWPHHPLFYVTLGLFVVTAVPQLLIMSATVTWSPAWLRSRGVVVPGAALMLPYWAGAVAFLYWAARTRRRAPLYLYIAAILCALAILAKGLAGLGLPVIVFLAYLLFTWNWQRLRRNQLGYGVLVALLGCAVVAIPWHHAMLASYGMPFWNELYGDNHWRRLVTGRHGDRGAFDYFLRELGYAALPFVPLAPAALMWGSFRRRRSATAAAETHANAHAHVDRRQDIFWLGAIWFVSAYAVVSLSITKFHHYILPALPGLALAIGCFLDDLLDEASADSRPRVAAAAALVGLPLLGLVLHDLTASTQSAQLFIWLFSYDYVNAPQGRPWPPGLDFRPALVTFGLLFALAVAALSLRRLRRPAVVLLGLGAVAFTYFLLDVFMPRTANHWSQKPLIAAYYQQRQSPAERLIAWQMFWRGETFYTKNEIFDGPYDQRTVFLGDKNQENLKDYIARNRGKRMFFIVEQTRWETLRSLLPADKRATLRRLDERNNKFYLAVADL